MIVVGVWTLYYEEEYHLFLGSTRYLIIVGLMIGIGGVVILVCVCGCYGTIKEHRYLLITVRICTIIGIPVELKLRGKLGSLSPHFSYYRKFQFKGNSKFLNLYYFSKQWVHFVESVKIVISPK